MTRRDREERAEARAARANAIDRVAGQVTGLDQDIPAVLPTETNPEFHPLEDHTFNVEDLPTDGTEDGLPAINPAMPDVTDTDPLYLRQASLGLTAPSVVLVGCGGVGVWAALSLVLGGVDNITLFDGDTLSEHNLNRFPLPPSFVGTGKSEALASWLRTLRPKAEWIRARGAFDPELHGEFHANWMVCATDSLKSRKACYEFALEHNMKYLEVGADGEKWSLSPAPPEFSTEDEDNPGYTTVPVHVGPCMMAGAAVAYYVLHGVRPSYSHAGGWDRGPVVGLGDRSSLEMDTIYEGDAYEVIGECPLCKREVASGTTVMGMVRHLRNDQPTLGLMEAKLMAEKIMEGWTLKAIAEAYTASGITNANTSFVVDSATAIMSTGEEVDYPSSDDDPPEDLGVDPVEPDNPEPVMGAEYAEHILQHPEDFSQAEVDRAREGIYGTER